MPHGSVVVRADEGDGESCESGRASSHLGYTRTSSF